MNTREASRLIAPAVVPRAGNWADLGAGEGTFTRALASLLEPGSRIFAVDRDAAALEVLHRHSREAVRVLPVNADFTQRFEWPGLGDASLDGMLFANALHYVPDPALVLRDLMERLSMGGRVIIVEYDRRGPNPWVPHPIPFAKLSAITAAAGLSAPVEMGRRHSAFGGDLYVAVADRLHGP